MDIIVLGVPFNTDVESVYHVLREPGRCILHWKKIHLYWIVETMELNREEALFRVMGSIVAGKFSWYTEHQESYIRYEFGMRHDVMDMTGRGCYQPIELYVLEPL